MTDRANTLAIHSHLDDEEAREGRGSGEVGRTGRTTFGGVLASGIASRVLHAAAPPARGTVAGGAALQRTIQRDAATPGTGRSEPSTPNAEAIHSGAAIDVEKLADLVYQRMMDEARYERERRGWHP